MKHWKQCAVILILGLLVTSGPVYAQDFSGEELTVILASPGEGETFYTAKSGFRISVPIIGQVISYNRPLHPETVEVTVELVEADGTRSLVAAPLDDSGRFWIWASLLSTGLPYPSMDTHDEEVCGECHRPWADIAMPIDVTEVVVSARAADGRTGQATRRLQFDRGEYREMPVVVEGLPEDSQNVLVRANTILYEWRPRMFYAAVADGQATLSVEGLFHTDLNYTVSMVPQVINGTEYSTEPVTTVVPAGGRADQPIMLMAHPTRGEITGRLVEAGTNHGLQADVLLVNLTGGESQAIEVGEDGTFDISDLDIARYALQAQADGFFHLPYTVNLAEDRSADIRVHLIPGPSGRVEGTVMAGGRPLPFAEAQIAGYPPSQADPLTGHFVINAVDLEEPVTLDVLAAGYYSVRIPDVGTDVGLVELTPLGDTQITQIGQAQLFQPAASVVRHEGNTVILDRGVAWVTGASGADVRLQVGQYLLQSSDADYGVESLPGALPRLYVSRGEVQVQLLSGGAPRQVAAGQTLALDNDTQRPVDMLPGEGAILRGNAGSVSIFRLAPTADEQRDAAAKQTVTVIAQGFMLLAYLITLVILPLAVIVIGGTYLARRLRS